LPWHNTPKKQNEIMQFIYRTQKRETSLFQKQFHLLCVVQASDISLQGMQSQMNDFHTLYNTCVSFFELEIITCQIKIKFSATNKFTMTASLGPGIFHANELKALPFMKSKYARI
jgi:hypothetical protein